MNTKLLLAVFMSFLLVACGGSNQKFEIKPRAPGASSVPTSSANSVPTSSSVGSVASSVASSVGQSSQAQVLTGVFLDAAVGNIGYRTATQSGMTTANGEFTYQAGELITFFIGDLEFPPVPGAPFITPLDLANTDDLNHPMVINIARLLQTLDADGDLSNGITISAEAIAAAQALDFSLSPSEFVLQPGLTALLAAAGVESGQLVSTEAALAHLQETLDALNGSSSSSSSSISAGQSSSSVVSTSSIGSTSSVPATSNWTARNLNMIDLGTGEELNPSPNASGSIVSQNANSVVIRATGGRLDSNRVFETFLASRTYNGEFVFTARLASVALASGAYTAPGNAYGFGMMVIQDVPTSVGTYENVPRFATINLFTATDAPTFGGSRAHKTDSAAGNRSRSNLAFAGEGFPARDFAVGDYMRIEVFRDSNDSHRVRRLISTDGSNWFQANSTPWAGTTSNNWHIGFFAAPGAEDLRVTFDNISVVPYGSTGSSSSNSTSSSSSSSAVVSSASSVSSVSSVAGTTLLSENFSAADADAFFSAAYKAMPGFPSTPLYKATAGATRVTLAGGSLSMNNARFTVGDNGSADTSASAQPQGVFNLSQPYRIRFTVTAVTGTGNIQVYVDNNTTSAGNSIHASIGSTASRLLQIAATDITSFPHEVIIDSSVGTPTSFIQIRADSNITNLTIRDLVIEYQSGGGISSSSSTSSVSSSSTTSSSVSVSSSSTDSSTSSVSSSSEPSSSSSEGSSSSVAPGIVNTQLPILEDFDGVVDAAGFFSVGYKALETEEAPFYHSTGGTPVFADGAMTLANGRFTLGNTTPGTLTTGTDTATTGELDLSEPYRISFCVKENNGAGNLVIYVDNNTTSQGASIHLNPSRLINQALSGVTSGQRFVVNSSVGSATSFIQLRVDSAGSATIDDLWIGYQSDTSTEPAGGTCVGAAVPPPEAPAAPNLNAGDGSIAVSWGAVAGATSYDVIYNTVNDVTGATAFANNPISGTSANITGLINGTTYYVFVRASNASGDSDYSPSSNIAPEESEVGVPGSWIGSAMNLFGSSGNSPVGLIENNGATTLTVTTSGGNVNGSNRRYYFAYQEITGDFVFTARLASVIATSGTFSTTGNNAYRFGLLITENINSSASYIDSARFAEVGFYTTAATPVFRGSRGYKLDTGLGSPNFSRSDIGAAGDLGIGHYLRIARSGTNIVVSYSNDGVSYTVANNTNVFAETNTPIPDVWYVGIFGAPQQELTFVFDNISIEQLP